MRSVRTSAFLALAALLTLGSHVTSPYSESDKDLVQVEAHGALSVSYAQVLLRITNSGNSAIFIPVCSEDAYEICPYFAYLEQQVQKDPSVWQRSHTESRVGGDVLAPRRVLRLGKGESCGCVFKFHPSAPLLADGSHLKYPGRVRVVILAWQNENHATDPKNAAELLSQEFEIPPPPETWGSGLER